MLGGALGALLRVLVAVLIHGDAGEISRIEVKGYFPFATLIVNIVGSFGLGYVVARFAQLQLQNGSPSETIFLCVGTGFFGALTTFSAFVYEVKVLVTSPVPVYAEAAALWAALALLAHLVGGVLVAALGYLVASRRFVKASLSE